MFVCAAAVSSAILTLRRAASTKSFSTAVADKAMPTVLFVLGGPGAGKGTLCSRLAESYAHICHLSAGDCLRKERDTPGSEHGDMIRRFIKEGLIVPVEVTVSLLKRAMEESESSVFLIDGFPRDAENVRGWNETAGDSTDVRALLFLDCSEDVMTERLMERAKTSGRSDDNAESIKKRFRVYAEATRPVIESFGEKCIRVDSSHGKDAVYEHVCGVMGDMGLL